MKAYRVMRWLGLLWLAAGGNLSAGPAEMSYRGFTLHWAGFSDAGELERMHVATKERIDMVHDVGLPDAALEFFKQVPFELKPLRNGSPGYYAADGKSVIVTLIILRVGHKPVLLHELLHAYHEHQLPDGYANKEIMAFLEEARVLKGYDAKSHMMSNQQEFFACAATTFLFGVTAQEPFQREKIKASQPGLIAYFQNLFGPGTGTYQGSLNP